MARARSAAAVLPALLPGALVVILGFQAGGFYPTAWAPVAVVLAVALALRVVLIPQPFAGLSLWSGLAAAAMALLAVWMLLSASWSGAPGRAVIEFVRLLTYLLVLLVCASLAPREHRLAWAVRGVAIAIAAMCVVGLISRLRPDLISQSGLDAGRLDFPVTYWNGLGLLAGIGALLAFHLSASSREPWPVRVSAAALVPIAACTLYFTLSRGAIIATAVGVIVYLCCGVTRATLGALIATVPATLVAVSHAYDADQLVTKAFADAAGRAQGRDVLSTLVLCVAGAAALRGLALLVDRLMRRVPSPGRLPIAARVGAAVAALLLAGVVAVGLGGPAWATDQVDAFLDPGTFTNVDDARTRLTVFNSNGRVEHWQVSLDSWRADPLQGSGAGTFQNEWNQRREINFQVLDAHSLYLETLGELGVVGLALLLIVLIAVLGGLVLRLPRPDRPSHAAVLAAAITWAVHAGVDWDWELTAVSVWAFALVGVALVREGPRSNGEPARLLRLVIALACLGLAIMPATLWRSQANLNRASAAFERGDCPATVDAALDSLGALGVRAEPWELIAYCDVRLGQLQLAEGAARAAIARDPGNWEYRYALALVRGAAGLDPRAAAAAARRLNPLEPRTTDAVRAFRTDEPRVWERRARRLPLYLR